MPTRVVAGCATPMMSGTLQLSPWTAAWLAGQPHSRKLVRSVWDTLAALEGAGHDPGAIAALRRVLTCHQPTPSGRCRTCRSWTWRRSPFPCIVWHQIRGELLGQFPTPTAQFDGLIGSPAVRWCDAAVIGVSSVGGDRHGQARHQRGRTVE